MSLFKARDWWSTTSGVDEEFDRRCLCISNIDNNPDGSAKIIVGSFNGFLRVYKPQPVKQENGSYSAFRADELLLEAQLNSPILQVCPGVLVSNSKSIHLAVLHPFKVSVYAISAVPGTVDHGTYYNLSLIYEHPLQRHSYAMVLGPFGGVQGRDLICVQSLDCTLNFFEQESFAFSRYLPNSLLPGPITYIKKTDSFVTVSGYAVESYRFQVLAAAKDDNTEDDVNKNFRGKKVTIDWSYNIGERGVDMISLDDRNQLSSVVIVLGCKSLYGLSPSGTLKFTKRFNFTPSCFMAHSEGIDSYPIILIATTKQTLLVYSDNRLKWAAQLPIRPICIGRSSFMDVKGLLVLLSTQGNLACCYLGTEPSLFVSPIVEPKQINFEEAEKEMRELKKTIKASNQSLLGTQNIGNEIYLTISMPQHANIVNPTVSEESSKPFGHTPSVTVKVNLKSSTVVHDVRLMIHVEPPFKVAQNVYTFGSVVDHTQINVVVSPDSLFLPSSLKFIAHVAYTSSQGTPRIYESSAMLPFSLITRACPPSKNADCKLTIDINKKVIPSSELFSDLGPDTSSVVGGAMGIEYYGGQQVTIVPSKSSSRYRLQSDTFPSLWLVFSELVRRLKHKYRKEDSSKLAFVHSSPLPLKEYFHVIEEHFNHRQQMRDMEMLLGQRSEQFRVVQKRLLTKMKDKTPTPLNNLDTLLEATHRHILSLADSLTKHSTILEDSGCVLSSATQLLLLLLRLSVNMKDDEHAFVTACFSPAIDFDSNQGWEERLNVSLTYLLKFCIGKGMNELGLPDMTLEMPKDVSKLKKHITILFDQIYKNAAIDITGSRTGNEESVVEDEVTVEKHLDEELIIPIGSKFADNSERKESLEPVDEQSFSKLPMESLERTPDHETNAENSTFSDYPEDDDGEEMII